MRSNAVSFIENCTFLQFKKLYENAKTPKQQQNLLKLTLKE